MYIFLCQASLFTIVVTLIGRQLQWIIATNKGHIFYKWREKCEIVE